MPLRVKIGFWLDLRTRSVFGKTFTIIANGSCCFLAGLGRESSFSFFSFVDFRIDASLVLHALLLFSTGLSIFSAFCLNGLV